MNIWGFELYCHRYYDIEPMSKNNDLKNLSYNNMP